MKKRILAFVAVFCLLFGMCADAAVTMNDMGTLAEPTEFPAEGYIHAQVYDGNEISGEHYQLITQECYLPVAVSADQTVYVDLEAFATKTDMNVTITDAAAVLKIFESSIHMINGSSIYTWSNDFYTYTLNGTAPVVYKQKWYVPLDVLLGISGCYAEYTEIDIRGKKILSIVRPERDLEDELIQFIRNEEKYRFSFEQLGMTEENIHTLTQDQLTKQFVYRFGSMDTDAFWYKICKNGHLPVVSEEDDEKWKTESGKTAAEESIITGTYLDNYMECLLQESEEILLDICENGAEKASMMLSVADMVSKTGELSEKECVQKAFSMVEQAAQIREGIIQKSLDVAGKAGSVGSVTDLLCGILFTKYHYENSSRFEVDCARAFLDKKEDKYHIQRHTENSWLKRLGTSSGTIKGALTDSLDSWQLERIESKVDTYEKYNTEAGILSEVFLRLAEEQLQIKLPGREFIQEARNVLMATTDYLKENGLKTAMTAADWGTKAIGATTPIGAMKFASSVWEIGGKILCGKQLKQGEAFLTACVGVVYQNEAAKVIQSEKKALCESITGKSTSGNIITRLWKKPAEYDLDREQLRELLYHAAKSCYAARELGMNAWEMSNGRSAGWEEQKAVQEELVQLCARLKQNPYVIFYLPDEREDLMKQTRDHMPNILYNMVELSGQIRDWEDEEPASLVRIQIASEEGDILADTMTDKEGLFHVGVNLDSVNLEDDRPVVRPLTFHMYYKNYPEVLESVQVECTHIYEIEGLHVGIKKEAKMIYLTGAREEDGKTVIDALEITLPDDCLAESVYDDEGREYPLYAPAPGEMQLGADMISLQLQDGVKLPTLYGYLLQGSGMLKSVAGMLYEEFIPGAEGALQEELRTAEEIQSYVQGYCKIEGSYPTLEVFTSNSIITGAKNAIILAPDGEGLGIPLS